MPAERLQKKWILCIWNCFEDLWECKKVGERYQIPNVYQTIEELIADTEIEIVDIALPPHVQKDIVRLCCEQDHIRGFCAKNPWRSI